MQTFIVDRPAVAASASELQAALMRLRRFEDQPRTLPVRWLHSYALREPDGRFGLACVFEAVSAAALADHARLLGLPAAEMMPVAATLRSRPFAAARVFLLRRRSFCITAALLDRCAGIAGQVADEMQGDPSWLRSYAVREPDGTFGTACLYQAAGIDSLRRHAARAGIPLGTVTPVVGRVVYRDEPKPPSDIGPPMRIPSPRPTLQ